MQSSAGFKLNNKVLYDRIEAIKKNPPQEFLDYLILHPEFKGVNCALIADVIGISEKTLTNLKLGKLTDSNCSTVGMICTTLGIDPSDYFGIPRKSECDPEKCTSHAQARLDEKQQRIAELDAMYKDADSRLVNLRTIIKDQAEALGTAKAKAEGLERLVQEKDKGILLRTRIIIGIVIALSLILAADLLVADIGWFNFGPIK